MHLQVPHLQSTLCALGHAPYPGVSISDSVPMAAMRGSSFAIVGPEANTTFRCLGVPLAFLAPSLGTHGIRVGIFPHPVCWSRATYPAPSRADSQARPSAFPSELMSPIRTTLWPAAPSRATSTSSRIASWSEGGHTPRPVGGCEYTPLASQGGRHPLGKGN